MTSVKRRSASRRISDSPILKPRQHQTKTVPARHPSLITALLPTQCLEKELCIKLDVEPFLTNDPWWLRRHVSQNSQGPKRYSHAARRIVEMPQNVLWYGRQLTNRINVWQLLPSVWMTTTKNSIKLKISMSGAGRSASADESFPGENQPQTYYMDWDWD